MVAWLVTKGRLEDLEAFFHEYTFLNAFCATFTHNMTQKG